MGEYLATDTVTSINVIYYKLITMIEVTYTGNMSKEDEIRNYYTTLSTWNKLPKEKLEELFEHETLSVIFADLQEVRNTLYYIFKNLGHLPMSINRALGTNMTELFRCYTHGNLTTPDAYSHIKILIYKRRDLYVPIIALCKLLHDNKKVYNKDIVVSELKSSVNNMFSKYVISNTEERRRSMPVLSNAIDTNAYFMYMLCVLSRQMNHKLPYWLCFTSIKGLYVHSFTLFTSVKPITLWNYSINCTSDISELERYMEKFNTLPVDEDMGFIVIDHEDVSPTHIKIYSKSDLNFKKIMDTYFDTDCYKIDSASMC